MKLIEYAEERTPADEDIGGVIYDTETDDDVLFSSKSGPRKHRLSSPTRSYEPRLTAEQLSLLTEAMNTLGVFTEKVTDSILTDLLDGKQPRLFHITNQKQFTYLFDSLRDAGYVTKTWIAVAGHNCDFASIQQPPANGSIHFITSQQFTNCRRANRSQAILGLNTIDELMERLAEL